MLKRFIICRSSYHERSNGIDINSPVVIYLIIIIKTFPGIINFTWRIEKNSHKRFISNSVLKYNSLYCESSMFFYLVLHRFSFQTIKQSSFNISRTRWKCYSCIMFPRHCLKTRGFSLCFTSSLLRHLSLRIIRITWLEL